MGEGFFTLFQREEDCRRLAVVLETISVTTQMHGSEVAQGLVIVTALLSWDNSVELRCVLSTVLGSGGFVELCSPFLFGRGTFNVNCSCFFWF